MYHNSNESNLPPTLGALPHAVAVIKGSPSHRRIAGTVKFYGAKDGVLVVADITGLPTSAQACKERIFGFHIHGGGACTGNAEDPFADAGTHFNPRGCEHPYHAGDLPPLFGAGGRAFLALLTNRFTVSEIIGKTVILHDRPDDFTTQPAGNAGNKIACGVIAGVPR